MNPKRRLISQSPEKKFLIFDESVQSGDRAFVAVLHKLAPEDDKVGVGTASAYVGNELNFLRGMSVEVVARLAFRKWC